jgi:hypothetical protein
MANTTQQLSDLTRRIARQEAKLTTLRHQLEKRLADLNRRRQELRVELRTVEAEIEAVADSSTSRANAPAMPTAAAPIEAPQAGQPTKTTSLPAFLIELVREANGRPLTVTELQQETVQRGYPTTSKHLREMVGARVADLLKQGRLRREPQFGGLVLAASRTGRQPSAQPTRRQLAPAGAKSKPGATKAATPSRKAAAGAGSQRSLREVVLSVLKKAGRTLSVEDLAGRVQQAGYQSASKNLKEMIGKRMGRIAEVEHDDSKGGYRLRKRKG